MLRKKAPFVTDYFTIWIENGIIHTTYPPNSVINLETAKKIVEDRKNYTNGIEYPALVDIRNLKKADYSAMKFLASKDSYQSLSRVAIFSDKNLSKIFFNFWLKVDHPFKPTRYFTNRSMAYLYLQPINVN